MRQLFASPVANVIAYTVDALVPSNRSVEACAMNRFNLTLLAIVLSPAAPHCFGAGPNYEQLRAVREISEMGGSVVIDESRPDKPVVSVNLVSEKVSDAGLECLENLHELQSLDLKCALQVSPFTGDRATTP